jgi:hypothetical protein
VYACIHTLSSYIHTYTYIYIYIHTYMCVCVCVCRWFDADSDDAIDLEEYEYYDNPGKSIVVVYIV